MTRRLCTEATKIRNVRAEKQHQPHQGPQASNSYPLSIYPSRIRATKTYRSSPSMAVTLSTTSLSAASKGTPERRSSVRATALPQKRFLFASRVGFVRRAVALTVVRSAPPTPGGISDKVSESIKKAEEACEGDVKSGECAAAWDEVEELSAAASHARDRSKEYDPLEKYCKDNPETNECRTFDN